MAETTSEYADIITVKDLQTGTVKYPRTVTHAVIDENGTTLSDHIAVIESDIKKNAEDIASMGSNAGRFEDLESDIREIEGKFNEYYTATEVDEMTEFSMFGTATEDPASILD